jgi:hypothetical protein
LSFRLVLIALRPRTRSHPSANQTLEAPVGSLSLCGRRTLPSSSAFTATTHPPPFSHSQTHLYTHCKPLSSRYRSCNHPIILFFLSHQTLPTTAPSPADRRRRRSQHTASACRALLLSASQALPTSIVSADHRRVNWSGPCNALTNPPVRSRSATTNLYRFLLLHTHSPTRPQHSRQH